MPKKETNNTSGRAQRSEDETQQLTNSPQEVYDADNAALVTRTPEQKRRSMHLFKLAEQAELIKWVALKHFFDGNGHLDLGYSTKKAFYANVLHEAPRTIEKKIQAAAPFAELMPIHVSSSAESGANEVENLLALEGLSDQEKENLAKVNQIGMKKLYLFARMEEADFSGALTDGIVKFGEDRPDIPLEEILAKSFRQWSADLKAEKDALTEKLNKYRTRSDEAEALVNKLKAEAEDNAEKVKIAGELEARHRKDELTLQQLYTLVHLAIERLSNAGQVLTKIRLPDDESKVPDDLRSLAASLHMHLSNLKGTFYDNNRQYIIAATEAAAYNTGVHRPEFDALIPNPDPNGKADWILDEEALAKITGSASQYDEDTGEVFEEKAPPSKGGWGDGQDGESAPLVANDEEELKIIRTDTQRMAIKWKTFGSHGHGWSNLETGFETKEEMEARYRELLQSEDYVEG